MGYLSPTRASFNSFLTRSSFQPGSCVVVLRIKNFQQPINCLTKASEERVYKSLIVNCYIMCEWRICWRDRVSALCFRTFQLCLNSSGRRTARLTGTCLTLSQVVLCGFRAEFRAGTLTYRFRAGALTYYTSCLSQSVLFLEPGVGSSCKFFHIVEYSIS